MAQLTAEANERNPAFDGLRGIAVLLVFFFHVYVLFGALAYVPKNTDLDSFAFKFMASGWVGVDLFFVLSGFLITGILLDAKGHSGYLRVFFTRRILRIVPLYYAFLVVLLLLARYHVNANTDTFRSIETYQVWFWSFSVNIPAAFPAQLGTPKLNSMHLWSLAIEQQFYLLWPFVALLLSRRGLLAACVVCIVTAFGFRQALALDEAHSWSHSLTPYYFTVGRMDTLAAGALIACLVRDPVWMLRLTRPLLLAASAALCALAWLAIKHEGFPMFGANDMSTIGMTAIALVFAAVVFLAATAPPTSRLTRLLSGATLTSIGRYSYAIYLFHIIVLGEYIVRINERGGFPDVYGSLLPAILLLSVVAFSTSYSLAWLSWHLYEKHFLKLKRFFPYGEHSASEKTGGELTSAKM